MQFLTILCTVQNAEITACFIGNEGKDALCRQGLQSLYHKYGTSYQPKWLEYRDTKKSEEFVYIDY